VSDGIWLYKTVAFLAEKVGFSVLSTYHFHFLHTHLTHPPLIEPIRQYHYIFRQLTMDHESMELQGLNMGTSNGVVQRQDGQDNSPEPQASNAEFSLPPVDTGKEAWLFLAACWVVEAFTFGKSQPLLCVPRISFQI
jgi:hypothetical protein